MQQSSKINPQKVFQKINNITFISLLYCILLSRKNTVDSKDLPRPKPKKPKRKISPELILVIVVMLTLIILPVVLYASGCMESTTYYNRRFV